MHNFTKEERLCSSSQIEQLFESGSSFFIYPFKVKYLHCNNASNNKVLVTVSKKLYKKAVDRNRIKRLMRESYRLNKHLLATIPPASPPILFSLNFVGKNILPFAEMHKKMIKVLGILAQHVNSSSR